MTSELEFALIGAGGEPVDFMRTVTGHGVTSLPPMRVDEMAQTLTVTVALPKVLPRSLTIRSPARGKGAVTLHGTPASDAEAALVLKAVHHMLRLDQDLSEFYEMAASDPDLAWVTHGAGRMTRCQTVFEDVVKTICTTNCAWSATVRMTSALVQHLGEPAADASAEEPEGRAFPTPAAMAAADDDFYCGIVRCGYRGTYLRTLAQSVAMGEVELEALGEASSEELPDEELATRLLSLPGVGPYAAAHIMMMLGRYSRLIFDSFTRPTYARLIGRDDVSDAEIAGRFADFGKYRGLAFWLFITRQWINDEQLPPGP